MVAAASIPLSAGMTDGSGVKCTLPLTMRKCSGKRRNTHVHLSLLHQSAVTAPERAGTHRACQKNTVLESGDVQHSGSGGGTRASGQRKHHLAAIQNVRVKSHCAASNTTTLTMRAELCDFSGAVVFFPFLESSAVRLVLHASRQTVSVSCCCQSTGLHWCSISLCILCCLHVVVFTLLFVFFPLYYFGPVCNRSLPGCRCICQTGWDTIKKEV